MNKSISYRKSLKWLTITALFMSLNIVLSMSIFSIPVPGGHMYLNDVIICTAAIILDPLGAFLVGGVGAFLGDFFFYPTPMFVSLVVHGLQAVVISLCARYLFKKRKYLGTIIGVTIGAVIMVVYLQHAGICDCQIALSDFAGGGGCRGRSGALLCVQSEGSDEGLSGRQKEAFQKDRKKGRRRRKQIKAKKTNKSKKQAVPPTLKGIGHCLFV